MLHNKNNPKIVKIFFGEKVCFTETLLIQRVKHHCERRTKSILYLLMDSLPHNISATKAMGISIIINTCFP